MAVCVPVKELKNTAEFTETVLAAREPVHVTRNGRESFVAMSPGVYDALALEAARARLYDAVDRGEADIAAGRTQDAFEFIAALRQRHAG